MAAATEQAHPVWQVASMAKQKTASEHAMRVTLELDTREQFPETPLRSNMRRWQQQFLDEFEKEINRQMGGFVYASPEFWKTALRWWQVFMLRHDVAARADHARGIAASITLQLKPLTNADGSASRRADLNDVATYHPDSFDAGDNQRLLAMGHWFRILDAQDALLIWEQRNIWRSVTDMTLALHLLHRHAFRDQLDAQMYHESNVQLMLERYSPGMKDPVRNIIAKLIAPHITPHRAPYLPQLPPPQ